MKTPKVGDICGINTGGRWQIGLVHTVVDGIFTEARVGLRRIKPVDMYGPRWFRYRSDFRWFVVFLVGRKFATPEKMASTLFRCTRPSLRGRSTPRDVGAMAAAQLDRYEERKRIELERN